MIRAHADAVLALLAAAPGTGPLAVYDGAVPEDATGRSKPPPYALVYFADADPEEPDSRPLSGRPARYVLRAYVHSVGLTASASRSVGERVRAALLNVRPTVAGRQCWPIRREDGQPPQRDDSTGSPVMDRVDVYRLESEPA
ncbi:hypothetical protein [Micromonospora robiginosa]|uniref:DUF3168 domain-containing protein n=1 Tax=Micromonospora robiginosa TaxID=2749844 RepID=A0A7L6B850_9ACTN|nr:hypothetical protein [Micromonospora ferruginea]QLQ37989.1 hypothetical protein H1D33_03595 [Micromonospora ferruginea]